MYYPKRQLILTWTAALLAGCVLHALYRWCPNAVTALFSPVAESLWEHVKLIFWPYLGAALILARDRPGGARPWLWSWGGSTTSPWEERPCGWTWSSTLW